MTSGAKPARASTVARSIETGAILGVLALVLAATGLLLSPTVGAAVGFSAAEAGVGNALYAVHMAAAALLVAFTLWHLWPLARGALARKTGQAAASYAASLALLVLIGVEVFTGYVLWRHDYALLAKRTAVLAHLATTFLLLAPLAAHAWRGARVWLKRRRAAEAALAAAASHGRLEDALAHRDGVSRRAALRVMGYAAAGVALAVAFGQSVTGSLGAWRLNSVGAPHPRSLASWRLRVTGLVGEPIELSFRDLEAIGPVTRRITHRCVEGWTYTDDFTGVPLRDVLALAGGPAAGARQVVLKSWETSTSTATRGQRYTTNFPIGDALTDDALLAWEVGRAPMPHEHGGPVRLMTPHKWGYKACKWLEEIEVSGDADYRGYWERLGYHNDGDYPGPIFQ